jgi:rRNA maturation RNase YbeY
MITFHSEIAFTLKHKTILRQWINSVAQSYKKECGELTYLFTSDDAVWHYNQTFLQHNTYTDIITFDSSEKNVLNGDIIISIDRVKENAQKFGVAFENELHRVMIHGVLHLCGLKDKKAADAAAMRGAEDKALRLWKKIQGV